MEKIKSRQASRKRRHRRVRTRVSGTAQRPRLNVFRSIKHIYAQVIDDESGQTLAAASSLDGALRAKMARGSDKDAARQVGMLVGQRSLDAGINTVVFDRGGYIFHGRVRELAEGAREAGLKF